MKSLLFSQFTPQSTAYRASWPINIWLRQATTAEFTLLRACTSSRFVRQLRPFLHGRDAMGGRNMAATYSSVRGLSNFSFGWNRAPFSIVIARRRGPGCPGVLLLSEEIKRCREAGHRTFGHEVLRHSGHTTADGGDLGNARNPPGGGGPQLGSLLRRPLGASAMGSLAGCAHPLNALQAGSFYVHHWSGRDSCEELRFFDDHFVSPGASLLRGWAVPIRSRALGG